MKFINSIIINFIFIVLVITNVYGGTDGTIRGKVSSVEGELLMGAQIFIEELGIGAVADLEGNYILLNVPVGSHDISVAIIGYKKYIMKNVGVIMDKTLWLNFSLEVAVIEGETIYVSAEKELVDKSATSKKITISSEAIESLPIRDVSELYTLQSGVVKVEGGMRGAIPDHEDRGLEEVHVRGGRSGEIAYMIDGLYIRNPIFGGIGNGTRLNLFAIQELDWQPGGFNAEYGDALSAVSNLHTKSGEGEYQYKFKYETSGIGAFVGNEFDSLRGYEDYNFGFGGPLLTQKLKFWVSGQYTNKQHFKVFKFDDNAYIDGDPNNEINKENLVQPWDNVAGYRGFGFDRTWDIFGKLTFQLTNKIKTNFSYWVVAAHRKGFGLDEFGEPRFLYWNEGQNELFRDTERYTFEVNQSLSSKTFYTIRMSRFVQDQFMGVRYKDSDSDGYPDWFEWSNPAGKEIYQGPTSNFYGIESYSDPYNPNIIPYTVSNAGDTVLYIKRDGDGPQVGTSGWYHGAVPGNYNWQVAEDWSDANHNGIWDAPNGIPESYTDANGDGKWNGPKFLEECIYRDGSYWLTPEMYVDYENFYDLGGSRIVSDLEHDPYFSFNQDELNQYISASYDSLYFFPTADGGGFWSEGRTFGGHDKFYGTSTAITNEFKFDITSQINAVWRARAGIDLKSHKLNYNEVKYPWNDHEAFRQRFAEQWVDYGLDDTLYVYSSSQLPDYGEGNGKWDPGEEFDDFNGNGKWDDYVEPMEVSAYFQNTYEVPWFVAEAGVRIDLVNYNSKIWSDENGKYSPNKPWFWMDCGLDGVCPNDPLYNLPIEDGGQGGLPDSDGTEGDGIYQPYTDLNGSGECDDGDIGECVTDDFGQSMGEVFFKPSEWFYKVSPRIGFSHIITDQSTFTFNYGIYYQTPIYQNIYLNTFSLADPLDLFTRTESSAIIGNGTMTAGRTEAYEFAFNVQVGRYWAYSIGGWVKMMDQLSTAKTFRSGSYEYQVASNGDYGIAKGIDVMLENKGMLVNTTIQYTYSVAKANGQYDQAAFGVEWVDAPSQQFLMPYDRPHDLAVTLYSTKLPYDITASMTAMYQSGVPYTPVYKAGNNYKVDHLNKNSKRMDSYKVVNISFNKGFVHKDYRIAFGLNIYNLFDTVNAIDIYPITGKADNPGNDFTKNIGLPEDNKTLSSGFYDRPWFYGSPREINCFIQIEYK